MPSHPRPRDWRRGLRPDLWRLESLTTACVVGGALLAAHVLKAFSNLRPDTVDFVILKDAVSRWLLGGRLYDPTHAAIDYNAPQLHVLLLPFASLSRPLAFGLWTLAGVAAAFATVRIAMSEASDAWTAQEERLLMAGILLAAGTGAALHLGQVSWLVALPLTLAWRAARHSRWTATGIWLGTAMALKPFLLVFLPVLVIRRRWTALLFTCASAAASLGAGAAVFGFSALRDWLHLLSAGAPAGQISYFINASLWAVLVRAGVPTAVCGALAVVLVAISIVAVRSGNVDGAWLVTILCSLLASPLGWVYYLPLVTAPLIVLARRAGLSPRAWAAWPLLAFPPIARDLFQSHAVLAITAGSVYTWGLLFLWGCAVSAAMESIRSARQTAVLAA